MKSYLQWCFHADSRLIRKVGQSSYHLKYVNSCEQDEDKEVCDEQDKDKEVCDEQERTKRCVMNKTKTEVCDEQDKDKVCDEWDKNKKVCNEQDKGKEVCNEQDKNKKVCDEQDMGKEVHVWWTRQRGVCVANKTKTKVCEE